MIRTSGDGWCRDERGCSGRTPLIALGGFIACHVDRRNCITVGHIRSQFRIYGPGTLYSHQMIAAPKNLVAGNVNIVRGGLPGKCDLAIIECLRGKILRGARRGGVGCGL